MNLVGYGCFLQTVGGMGTPLYLSRADDGKVSWVVFNELRVRPDDGQIQGHWPAGGHVESGFLAAHGQADGDLDAVWSGSVPDGDSVHVVDGSDDTHFTIGLTRSDGKEYRLGVENEDGQLVREARWLEEGVAPPSGFAVAEVRSNRHELRMLVKLTSGKRNQKAKWRFRHHFADQWSKGPVVGAQVGDELLIDVVLETNGTAEPEPAHVRRLTLVTKSLVAGARQPWDGCNLIYSPETGDLQQRYEECAFTAGGCDRMPRQEKISANEYLCSWDDVMQLTREGLWSMTASLKIHYDGKQQVYVADPKMCIGAGCGN